MARLLQMVDGAFGPIVWLCAAYPAQSTVVPEAGLLKSSHCV